MGITFDEKNPDGDFDNEAVYDEQIAPLMAQIIKICRANGIPMIASFWYARNAEDVESFCTTVIQWEDRHHEKFQRALKAIKP